MSLPKALGVEIKYSLEHFSCRMGKRALLAFGWHVDGEQARCREPGNVAHFTARSEGSYGSPPRCPASWNA